MAASWKLGAAIAVLAYLGVSLDYLSVFPPVGEDEPWIAAASHKLANEGVLGSDLFTGYYNEERRSLRLPPLFPLSQAVVFRVADTGVLQMRIVPVLCGALVLVAVFALGAELGGGATGLVAVGLLLLLRLGTGHAETGIPLLDIARVGRPDVLVAALGLTAWSLFNLSSKKRWYLGHFLVGSLIGLATLAHLYGVFWLIVMAAFLAARHGRDMVRRPEPMIIAAGFVLVLLPWAIYATVHWSDFLGQMRVVGDRFDLLNPIFYIDNALREIDRYRILDMRDSDGHLAIGRPGFWSAALGIPIAVGLLLRHLNPWRASSADLGQIAIALLLQVALFTLLIRAKFSFYIVAFWPIAMLSLAWLSVWLWRNGGRVIRAGLVSWGCIVVAEGIVRIAHRHTVASRTTPYDAFEARLASEIPADARILGLQHYWLGLHDHPYRTWLLPLFLSDSVYHDAPVTLREALGTADPDVVLIGRYMREVLERDRGRPGSRYADFWHFLEDRQGTLVASVDDETYGRVDVYHLIEDESSR